MLNIVYGELNTENYIYDPDTFFNHQYSEEWFSQKRSREMIKDVDKSEVIEGTVIRSDVLGAIPPERLSGGVKTLMLIDNDSEHIFNASACGDNCAKWLLEIGKEKDVTIRLGYLMDFGNDKFEINVVNTGKVVNNLGELDDEVIDNDLLV